MRGALRVVLYFVLAAAVFFVPTGFYLVQPGLAVDAGTLVMVPGCAQPIPDRAFYLTSVAAQRATVGQILLKGLSPGTGIIRAADLFPEGVGEEEYLRSMKTKMKESQGTAVKLALKEAGYPTDQTGGSLVPVTFEETEVAGPSAGLMFALEAYERLLALKEGRCGQADPGRKEGRVIAGTGVLSPSGAVEAVSGVEAKAIAARRAGAYLFLIPKDNLQDISRSFGNMKVVPVEDLDEALRAAGF